MSAPRRPRPGPETRAPDVPDVPDAPLPAVALVLGVIMLVVIAALGAALSVLLTPFRVGATLVPVAVVLAVVLNAGLPRLGWALSRSRGVAALPVVVFFVAGWALSIAPGGDVLLAGGSGGQTATSYATLLLGGIAGVVAAVRVG